MDGFRTIGSEPRVAPADTRVKRETRLREPRRGGRVGSAERARNGGKRALRRSRVTLRGAGFSRRSVSPSRRADRKEKEKEERERKREKKGEETRYLAVGRVVDRSRTPLHAAKSPCVEAEWETDGGRTEEGGRGGEESGSRQEKRPRAGRFPRRTTDARRLPPRARVLFSGPCARRAPFLLCARKACQPSPRRCINGSRTGLGMAE